MTDAALSSGQLPWTKGRLLCRVATPGDEGRWLEPLEAGDGLLLVPQLEFREAPQQQGLATLVVGLSNFPTMPFWRNFLY